MNIGTSTASTTTFSAQQPSPQASILKTANYLPKTALQLIPPVPQASGNIGNNIDVFV